MVQSFNVIEIMPILTIRKQATFSLFQRLWKIFSGSYQRRDFYAIKGLKHRIITWLAINNRLATIDMGQATEGWNGRSLRVESHSGRKSRSRQCVFFPYSFNEPLWARVLQKMGSTRQAGRQASNWSDELEWCIKQPKVRMCRLHATMHRGMSTYILSGRKQIQPIFVMKLPQKKDDYGDRQKMQLKAEYWEFTTHGRKLPKSLIKNSQLRGNYESPAEVPSPVQKQQQQQLGISIALWACESFLWAIPFNLGFKFCQLKILLSRELYVHEVKKHKLHNPEATDSLTVKLVIDVNNHFSSIQIKTSWISLAADGIKIRMLKYPEIVKLYILSYSIEKEKFLLSFKQKRAHVLSTDKRTAEAEQSQRYTS